MTKLGAPGSDHFTSAQPGHPRSGGTPDPPENRRNQLCNNHRDISTSLRLLHHLTDTIGWMTRPSWRMVDVAEQFVLAFETSSSCGTTSLGCIACPVLGHPR